MGILGQDALRIGELDLLQQGHGLLGRLAAGQALPSGAQNVVHHAAHSEHRVQAAHGILKDHGDLAAPHALLHLPLAELQQVLALQKALLGRSINYSASDFNYEHDSLDLLKKFGINHLKTATKSVRTALSNQRDMNAFSRFVNLAIVAGFSITATGIETDEEAKFASSFDIAFLEGYFFGRPMGQEDFLNAITYGAKSRQ